MKRLKFFIPFLFPLVFLAPRAWSQAVPFYAEPALSLSKSLKGRWSANSKLVFRQQLASLENRSLDWVSQSDAAEIQLFVNYRIFVATKLTLGYIYKLEEPFLNSMETEHRLLQQLTFQSGNSFRSNNRIRLEQRIGENSFRNRLRYWFIFEQPLFDKRDWYFVASDELLYTFTGMPGEDQLENRLHAGLGYMFDNGQKLQFELQYRLKHIAAARQSSAWHLLITYSLKL